MKIITHKELTAIEAEKKCLLEKCQGLENEVTNLKDMSKDMTEAQAEHNNVITTLKADSEKASVTMKAEYDNKLTALKVESDKAFIDLKTATDKTISDLTNQVKEASASSEAKAITIVANLGVPIDDLPPISNNVTNNSPEAKLNTFLAMSSGTEKTAYYNTNRADIVRASNAKAANK